ncbi:MAG: hypothetical protein P8M17_08430 [Saprospiraceae bacterium]|nr:hypothetical protein [Saprospiraceae bacterium]
MMTVFWTIVTGADPIELMKGMKGQIRLFHRKWKSIKCNGY